MDIQKILEETTPYIVEQRRWFHQNPELSWKEWKTTAHIAEELRSMDIAVKTYKEHPGLVGTLCGGKPGKTLILRADIDALPIREETQLPFCSRNPGVMHACGHDGHAAMLLGAARILAAHREELSGTVKFLFQIGEESGIPSGALQAVEDGELEGADAIFGMHIWADIPLGTVNFEDGERMASSDKITINVKGRAAPAGSPHLGGDTVLAAAAVVCAIQSIVSRRNPPDNAMAVTIGLVESHSTCGQVTDECTLKGIVRMFRPAFRKQFPAIIKEAAECAARIYNCEAEVQYDFMPPPVINDSPGLCRLAREAAEQQLGAGCLIPMERMMIAEDFAEYMVKIPAVYGFIGTRNPEKGVIYNHHNSRFMIDEAVLPDGTGIYLRFALEFLRKNSL